MNVDVIWDDYFVRRPVRLRPKRYNLSLYISAEHTLRSKGGGVNSLIIFKIFINFAKDKKAAGNERFLRREI